MIQIFIVIFALLLFLVSWFLLKKAHTAFILFPEKYTEEQHKSISRFFHSSGIIYSIFGVAFLISIFIDQKFFYALLLVLISIHSAFFSLQLAKILKGK